MAVVFGIIVVVFVIGLIVGRTGVDDVDYGDVSPERGGWSLYWSDEFTTPDWTPATLVDPQWAALNSTYGEGNNELACLTPANVAAEGGVAVITADRAVTVCPGGAVRNYSSGFLSSRDAGRFYPLFGRFEIRARIPHGQGLWPAFWLRHRNGAGVAEVDVMESFHSQAPGSIIQTLHFPGSIGRSKGKVTTPVETPVQGTGDWHIYAVEIEPTDISGQVRFRFFVDEKQTSEFVNRAAQSFTEGVPMTAAWDLAVNLAVGGNFVGDPDGDLGFLPHPNRCSLDYLPPPQGDPAACSTDGLLRAEFPAHYDIDYVRVYTRP